MVPQPIMTSMQKAATQNMGIGLKGSALHRNHYSGPSGAGYHQHHHIYHVSDSEGYGGHGHSDHGGSKKKGIALSALTLLAFLFFLNILQNCIQDQMDDMNPQFFIMTSRLQQLKEAQKRIEESKSVATDPSVIQGDQERSADKLQRKSDNTAFSSNNNYANKTFKIISNSNRNSKPIK